MQKNIFIIVSCVVLVIAAIVGTVFLIETDDLEPETAAIEIQGTWRVYQKGNNNPGYSYFVFDDSKVVNYRDGSLTPAFESEYSLNGMLLGITNLAQDFSVEKKTDSILLLYNQTSEYLIVKVKDNEHTSIPSFSQSDFLGKYSVSLHGNNIFGEEYIEFSGMKFINTRNGSEYVNTTFTVSNNKLSIITAGGAMEFDIVYNDGDVIRFVENGSDGHYLGWELVRIGE